MLEDFRGFRACRFRDFQIIWGFRVTAGRELKASGRMHLHNEYYPTVTGWGQYPRQGHGFIWVHLNLGLSRALCH